MILHTQFVRQLDQLLSVLGRNLRRYVSADQQFGLFPRPNQLGKGRDGNLMAFVDR